MGADTKIEWAHHTMNFWYGCTAVSPACDHCYADALVTNRMGKDFAERHRTSVQNWNLPFRWDRAAAAAAERHRVFTLSLGDFWDNKVNIKWRVDAFDVIRRTPHLDWLILTKRPQMIMRLLRSAWGTAYMQDRMMAGTHRELMDWLKAWIEGTPPANVWLGTTVENQEEADRRIPHLQEVPAVIRFLSGEPLLEGLRLDQVTRFHEDGCLYGPRRIHWVIAGGESGPGARPSHPQWYRDLRDQCAAAGAAFMMKQWGDWIPEGQTPAEMPKRLDIYRRDWIRLDGAQGAYSPTAAAVHPIGKKRAGRLLDGVEHTEFPVAA